MQKDTKDRSTFGKDFGQKVDLTASIRNILRNYPEGTAVLKELVQNADDAGARRIAFYIDSRHHGVSTLADPILADFQGTSLLIYNDAIFSEEDFKSIQRIGDSLKKTSESSGKIGRFGIGFNAVYHWTDLPSFVSSKYLVMLDPQARFLPNVNPSNPGKIVDFTSKDFPINEYHDQFSPYELHSDARGGWNKSWNRPFNGTLFRLPLRTKVQAESSLLSKRHLSLEDAKQLLLSLQEEAASMLLFLKNIEQIEIFAIEPSTADGNRSPPVPRLLFGCNIADITTELRSRRSYISDSRHLSAALKASISVDFSLKIVCRGERAEDVRDELWELCNQLGGPEATAIAGAPENALLRLIPWGGVAACIDIQSQRGTKSKSVRDGVAYCFLPLPIQTQLPVMLNGFFELSSNRRDVWQSGSDMTGEGRTRANWNIALMRDILAPSYVRLLLKLRDKLGFSDLFQQFWPSATISSPWDTISNCAMTLCASQKLLCPSILCPPSTSSSMSTSLKKDKWIEVKTAVLLPASPSLLLSSGEEAMLVSLLAFCRVPIVECIPSLRATLEEKRVCAAVASPAILRKALHIILKDKSFSDEHLQLSLRSSASFLLRFCIRDFLQAPAEQRPYLWDDLHGLPLLPMRDGSLGYISIFNGSQVEAIDAMLSMGFHYLPSLDALKRSSFNMEGACSLLSADTPPNAGILPVGTKMLQIVTNVAISKQGSQLIKEAAQKQQSEEEEWQVFSAAADMFIDFQALGPQEISFLCDATWHKHSSVKAFSSKLIPDLLAYILPLHCNQSQSQDGVRMESLTEQEQVRVREFLLKFWRFAVGRADVITAIAQAMHIVPVVSTATDLSFDRLLPLSRLSNLIASSRGDKKMSIELIQILQQIGGVHIVSPVVDSSLSCPVFWEYIHSPNRSGIISSFGFSLREVATKYAGEKKRGSSSLFGSLTALQRDLLRAYFATEGPTSNLTDAECGVLRDLPIFPLARDPSQYTSLNASFSLLDADRSKSCMALCLYPQEYLTWSSPQELLLLKQLKVKTVSRGEFYRRDLLPRIQTLYSNHPEEVLTSLRYILEDLNYLLSADQLLLPYLKTCTFIPSNSPLGEEKGGASAGLLLHKAEELFDPEELELASLLGQECFPSVLLLQRQGGEALQPLYSSQILSSLRKLGLQQTVTWRGLVSCANSIAEMPESSTEQRQMKKFKGAQLLSFLDRHITDFMGDPETEKEKEREKEKGGKSFSSMFGIKNIMGSIKGASAGTDSSGKIEKERIRIDQETIYLPQLMSIAWLPVIEERLDPLMPWPRNLSTEEVVEVSSFNLPCLPLSCCASPRESVSIAEAWLASYSKRILDTSPLRLSTGTIQEPLILSNKLKKAFGWNQTISATLSQEFNIGPVTVALQLRELARLFSSVFSATTEESNQRTRELITALIPQIYQHLNSCLRSAGTSQQGDEQLVLSILQSCIWLWMGDRFVSIDCVALTASVTAAPYLYQLPQDLQVYGKLLKLFKVRTSFSARDYIEALRRMAADSGALESDIASSPLSEQLIDVSVSLATLLTTETSSSFLSQLASHSIYIPDQQGRLALSTTLVHDDVPWLSGQEYIHLRKSYRLCHPNLSAQVASRLGVQSMRLGLINLNLAQQLFQGSSNQVEGFGQAESLTSRLRTILDMYPDGNPIFSELIQNADDAGATRLDILLDETCYPTESLLDAKMAELQGPALVVRNDAVFTENDFRALARIGQGSKLERLSTTGRFGLGFNSTYHLTDTPSFLTGNYFVIFDPHCAYVPGTTLNQPGLRIKVTDSSLADAFPDQFLPFKQFSCDCRSTYPGTLFRFPLRTASMARHSEISKRSYTLEELRTTLHQLSEQLPTLLLFLRNVKQISIYHKPQGKDNTVAAPYLLSTAVAQVIDKEIANDQSLFSFLTTKEGQGSKESFYKQLLSTPDKKLPMCCYKLRIESRTCPATSLHPPLVAGVMSIPESVSVVEYLIVSGLQGGKAKAMACDDSLRHLKLVPLGAVAACLSVCKGSENVVTYPSTKGQLFCYLPVPSVTTRLPVHINALWELSSNRRDIWMGEDTNGLARRRADWNLAVMQDILAPLYVDLMSKVHNILTNSTHASIQQQVILSLLPGSLNSPWDTLQTAVFSLLSDKAFLFSNIDGGRCVTFKEAYLLEREKSAEDERGRLEDLLLMERLAVVRIAPADCTMLLDRNCVAGKVTPAMVRNHFRASGNAASSNAKANVKQMIHPSIVDTNPQRVENATYLLQYCCNDLDKTSQSFEQLLGVWLLPLHSQEVTRFQNHLDAPFYFLAEDIELQVLQRCGASRIVAASLGSHVLSIVKHSSFSSVCNVKAISPIELLMLIRTGLPPEWLTADRISIHLDNAKNHPPNAIVVDEVWLRSLWAYILETKAIDLFKEVLPIVPVLGKEVINSNIPPGHITAKSDTSISVQPSTSNVLHLARISPRIPILHMSYASLPPDAITGLADLNVFILHAKPLGTLTFSNTLTQLIQESSPRGLLNSLNMISPQCITDVSSGWSVNIKQAIQDLVLDCLAKINSDSLTANDKQVLYSLPVWRRRKPISLARMKGGRDDEYGVLDAQNLCLPPLGVAEDLLDERFLVLRNEKDRSLYSLLGVPSINQGAFYLTYALPISKNMDLEQIRVMTFDILSNLTRFEEQQPGLKIALRDCPLIRNQLGQYKTPRELFDPQERTLISILPPEMFPHSDFTSLLHSLRSLGLRMDLDADGVLEAATAIQADPASMIASTLSKSEALLRYLEANIERFSRMEQSNGSNQDSSNSQEAEKEESGSAWKKKLQSIMWIAAHVNIPPEYANSCIPWPQRMHSSPFATPAQCLNSTDIWYGSSSHRISVFEVRSVQLLALLGWDKPIPGRTLILQLLSLQQSYQLKNLSEQSKLQESVSKIFPVMLKKLQAAFECETPQEIDRWLSATKDKDFFWVEMSGKLGHGRFIRPSQLSFTQLSEINMEPFLFLVPPDYVAYKQLLLRMGCQESFQITDLADLNRRFYLLIMSNNRKNGTTTGLSTPNVQFVVGCLQLIHRLVCEGAVNSQDTKTKETTIGLNLGSLYAPDKSNLLQLTTSLTFDDAPWISALMSTKACRIVHSSIDPQLATFLGCRSLREQLFAGEDIVCPHSSHLRSQVQHMGVTDVLDDLLALGDTLGATNVTCIFDDYYYPTESLMHPGLGFAQGPALLVYMQGNFSLSGEQISKLLTRGASHEGDTTSTSTIVKSLGMRLISCFALCDCLQILSGREFFIFDPVGVHLLSTSPAPSSSTGVDAPASTPQYASKAQRYQLSSKKSSSEQEDVLLQFPDQFQVFSSLPFSLSQSISALSPAGMSGGISGAVLRLPLRLKETPWQGVCQTPLTSEDLASVEEYFRNRAIGSLLFGQHLTSLTLSHHSRFTAPAHRGTKEDVKIQLSKKSLSMVRQLRSSFLTDRSWDRKNQLTKMFQTYAPVEIECSIVVGVTTPTDNSGYWTVENFTELILASNSSEVSTSSSSKMEISPVQITAAPATVTSEEEWYMLGINGSKRLRQLASAEPYYSLKLQPVVCIASKLDGRNGGLTLEKITPAPWLRSGAAYSSAHKFMMTGLPFLVEGSFLTTTSGSATSLNQPLLRNWNESILYVALEHLCLKLIDTVKLKTDQLLTSVGDLSPQLVAQSFYRHWPTSSKKFPQVGQVLLQCTLFHVLTKMPLFLCQVGAGCQFRQAAEVIFITEEMSDDALTYLRSWLPLTLCPKDLASDLSNIQQLTTLSPQYLRFHLSRNPEQHSRALREKSELLLSILSFLLQDIESATTQASENRTEDILRKKVKEMAGVPALLMVDGCVRTFPRSVAEQVAVTSPVFHALLPRLNNFFVHPVMFERFSIFKNPAFLELLFISASPTATVALKPMFLAAHLQQIFPSIMLNRPVVEWALNRVATNDHFNNSHVNPQILSTANMVSSPSPLLLFNIWQSISSETVHTLCTSGLGHVALLPVLSKGRKILLAIQYATAIFQREKELEEDIRQRVILQRETDNLLHQSDNGVTVTEEITAAVETSQSLSTNTPATRVLPSAVPDTLYSALSCLGLPFLDFSLLQSLPNEVVTIDSNTPPASLFGRRLLHGLHTFFSANLTVVPYSLLTDNSIVQTEVEQDLLDFASLSIPHRRDILLAIVAAAPLTPQEIVVLKQLPLFTRHKDGLAVNLFDETRVASTTSQQKKVFWCNDPVLLQTLTDIESGPSRPVLDSDYYSNANPASSSLVLRYDPALVELYALLSVHELTPTVSVKEFVVPHIHKMSGEKRLQVMLTLSQQWAQYRTDPELLQTLRTVQFLPSWTFDPQTTSSAQPLNYRRADEHFLWTNEELLSTLTYPHGPGLGWVCRYYIQPELRTQQMREMCCDLNSMVDMNEKSMLALIADIEEHYRAVSSSSSPSARPTATDTDIESVCTGLSRRLLKYVLAEDRLSLMLQANRSLASKLSQLRFIPALRPLSVQPGGFVQYQEMLCCWSECCIGGQVGSLAFTVLPELEEELCPPQFHCSSLSITSAPSTEVVLRHLRNLTQSQLLDRWNTPRHPIAATFLAIFQHLQDKWSSLAPSIKESLAHRPLVPVGHSLIMPSRVFFRLSEDLSPFMHEIPRSFGAVESLLKQLGCKETPLMADYASFLRDLTKETTAQGLGSGQPQPLNPNELKAVLSIIGILAQQMEETKDSGDEKEPESGRCQSQAQTDLCLPDEESRMRPAVNCMVSDDPWLKVRSAPLANAQQLYFLHPLLDRHLASAVLKVPECSKVIEELLHQEMEVVDHIKGESLEEEQERQVRSQLNNPQFLQVLSSLILQYKNSRPITSTGTESSSTSLQVQISNLTVRFVKILRTEYRLRREYQRRNSSMGTKDISSMNTSNFQRSSIGDNETLFYMHHEKQTLLISRRMLSRTSNALSYEIAVSLGLCSLLHLDFSLATSIACIMRAANRSPDGCGERVSDIPMIAEILRMDCESANLKELLRGQPGEVLTNSDLQLMELKPFRVFRVGEIIAFSDQGSVHRYGKIVNVGATSGVSGVRQLSFKSDSNGTTSNLLSTEVFSFRSAREAAYKGREDQKPAQKASIFTMLSRGAASSKEEAKKGPVPLPPAPTNTTKPSPNGEVNLMEALDGLLVRVGLPVSLEQREMMRRILELEASNRQISEDLRVERSESAACKETLNRMQGSLLCQICISVEVSHVVVPCGHTFCEQCLNQLNRQRCPNCRCNIQQKIRFFLPEKN